MSDIKITINSQDYVYNASPSEQAGLDLAWDKVMQGISPGESQSSDTPIQDRPDYLKTSTEYLNKIITDWFASNPDGDVKAMMSQCIQSWDIAPSANSDPIVAVNAETVLDPVVIKNNLLAYADDKSMRIAQSGVTVKDRAMYTDSDSRTSLSRTYFMSTLGLANKFNIKTRTGLVEVDSDELKALLIGVESFVKTVIDTQAVIETQINNGSIKDQAGIDSFKWPENS